MILHLIDLTYVGPFRNPVRLGPFAPGLNLLCAPNESGKSTSLRAAARALFDKHTNKGEELRALQPAGTDLAPRVAVEFETRAGRFRIEKTFLQAPRSLLAQWERGAWQPIAEADAADQRMQELLKTTLPGRGATRPEHWGFLGFLWARQGEPVEWPKLADDAIGQQIRARLARVELDPVIERLRARLSATADAIVTATGQSRAGGPLRQAEDDLAALEAQLTALRAKRAELDGAHQRYTRANGSVAQLEKEHAERQVQAKVLAEQALAAERLRGELETRQVELAAAQEKLNAIANDAATAVQRAADIVRLKEALVAAEETAKVSEVRLGALREKLDRETAARPELEARLVVLRSELQRAQALLRLRQLTTQASQLEKQAAKADVAAAEAKAIAEQRAKLPPVSPARLKRLEELAELARTQQAQLQALGLTVELTPEREARVRVRERSDAREETLAAGESRSVHSPNALELELSGWGRVTIRSGAKEAAELARELAATQASMQAGLQELGVLSVAAAHDALAKRRELDAQAKAAEAALAAQLGEHASGDALRAAAASAAHRVAALTATLQPSTNELARSNSELESEEASRTEAIPAAERTLKAFDAMLAQLRTDERRAAEALQKGLAAANEQRTHLRTLESQATDLAARYPSGLEAAKARAQVDFTQAEARVVTTRAGLPADFERLPERNRRAAAALQQLANELQVARAERDNARGALEILGGEGLYSRETEIEEKKTEAALRRDAARTKGWAARIAQTLLEHRKQAATKAVLQPLEQRLTGAFAELTGDRGRQVFLDEHLQIAGIGRARSEAHPFELLSQGAKEQLLLCLRIAVAQELAAVEPQVLILDDVLVNTDSVRQERVLDVLSSLATTLQVVVLTCHADRYRGAGTEVKIKS
jgi:energy-coupling factor transporter ATP-binding protein EcfA2